MRRCGGLGSFLSVLMCLCFQCDSSWNDLLTLTSNGVSMSSHPGLTIYQAHQSWSLSPFIQVKWVEWFIYLMLQPYLYIHSILPQWTSASLNGAIKPNYLSVSLLHSIQVFCSMANTKESRCISLSLPTTWTCCYCVFSLTVVKEIIVSTEKCRPQWNGYCIFVVFLSMGWV